MTNEIKAVGASIHISSSLNCLFIYTLYQFRILLLLRVLLACYVMDISCWRFRSRSQALPAAGLRWALADHCEGLLNIRGIWSWIIGLLPGHICMLSLHTPHVLQGFQRLWKKLASLKTTGRTRYTDTCSKSLFQLAFEVSPPYPVCNYTA